MAPGKRAGAWRAIWLLAAHEVRRVLGAFRRPSTLVAVAAAAAVLAAAWPLAVQEGIQPDRGLYPVTVHPGSPLAAAVDADHRFQRVAGGLEGGALLELGPAGPRGAEVRALPGRAGHAALQALEEAVRRWQEGELEREADADAAFPVQVDIVLAVAPAGQGGSPAPGTGGGTGTGTASGPGTTAGTTGPGGAATGTGDGTSSGPSGSGADLSGVVAASTQRALRPDQVEPPFPVRSLLLTFAFLIPMNFVAQLYAGTLLADRSRKRALIALTTPHAPRTLLLGRSLPYVAASALVLVAAAVGIGAGWQGWLAAVPIVLFVLAASMTLGLLARSERELTFLLTGTTTMLSVFLFLPAIFTAIPAVAFLSPVSVLVASMQGDVVGPGLFLYATLPLALCTLALALVGSALYREETLFSPRRLRDKALSALALRTRTPLGAVVGGILAVPFAFALQLLVLSLAIPLGLTLALPIVLIGAAAVEERLKLAVSAAWRRNGRKPWRGGVYAGVGFFVGEKLAILLSFAGFGLLSEGGPTLEVFGVAGGWLLLLAPLVLHAACAAIAASGLGRTRPLPGAAFWGATALHVLYNATILWASGFGRP